MSYKITMDFFASFSKKIILWVDIFIQLRWYLFVYGDTLCPIEWA
jgi:hypothetical protein